MYRLKSSWKLKHFIWRVYNNALPTKLNLCNRLVVNNPNCPFCVVEWELVIHILWECPFARNVWALVSGPNQKKPRMNIFWAYKEIVKDNHDGRLWELGDDLLELMERKKSFCHE